MAKMATGPNGQMTIGQVGQMTSGQDGQWWPVLAKLTVILGLGACPNRGSGWSTRFFEFVQIANTDEDEDEDEQGYQQERVEEYCPRNKNEKSEKWGQSTERMSGQVGFFLNCGVT